MSSPRQRTRPRDRADQILSAATSLFAERGFHSVVMEDIGEAVGITGSAVYRHFESKEVILAQAVERALGQVEQQFSEALAAESEPAEALRAMIKTLVQVALDDQDLWVVFVREARHFPTDQRRELLRAQLRLTELEVTAVTAARPSLSRAEAALLATTITGMFTGPKASDLPLSRKKLDRLFERMALATLTGSGDASHDVSETDHESLLRGRSEPREAVLRASRRELILAAAGSLFRKRGFGGVGMDDLGAAAGMSGPAVYRYFRSKEDLVVAAFTRTHEQLMADVARAIRRHTDARDVVIALLTSYLRIALEESDLLLVPARESHHLSPESQQLLRQAHRDYLEEWVFFLRQAIPQLSDSEARTRAIATMGMAQAAAESPFAVTQSRQTRLLLDGLATALTQAT